MRKIYISLLTLLLFNIQISFAQQNPGGKQNRPSLSSGPKSLIVPGTGNSNNTIPPYNLNPDGLINDRCDFITQMNRAKAAGYDPAAFEAFISQKIASMKASKVALTNYIIPVVFHIIHDGTTEGTGANIIASQISQQIDQLNKDFGNLSGSPFAVAANTGITFCPVLKDPLGVTLAQPGIDRINRIIINIINIVNQ